MVSLHEFVSHLNVALFGLSSWLLVNSVWVELALLVEKAPEGYALASHMAIALQCANIFPLLYSILARWKDPPIPYAASIGLILALGIASCELLAQHWDHVAVVFGEKRSVALILLLFVGGALDCTSSVVYWPFISTFDEPYTATLATGESLSGSVPALLAAWQIPLSGSPLFGPRLFFHLMTAIMVVSSTAFALLHVPALRPTLAVTRTPRLLRVLSDAKDSAEDLESVEEIEEEGTPRRYREEAGAGTEEVDIDVQEEGGGGGVRRRASHGGRGGEEDGAGCGGDVGERGSVLGDADWEALWTLSRGPVLLEGWLKLLADGVYPSLLPFACKGFAHPLHLLFAATIASNLMKPLGAHLATYARLRSRRIVLLTAVWSAQVGAVVGLSFWSSGHALRAHGWLLVAVVGCGAGWVGYTHAVLFIELGLRCHAEGLPPAARTAAYRWAGQSTQAGALAGTVLAFVLVNFSGLFAY